MVDVYIQELNTKLGEDPFFSQNSDNIYIYSLKLNDENKHQNKYDLDD